MATMASTNSGSKSTTNPLMASIYAGALTGILAAVFAYGFSAQNYILIIIGLLLIGAGPVLGYQLAAGRGLNVVAIIGGVIGHILLFIGWPILVGALSKGQNIGKLLLGSILGIVLAAVVFMILAGPVIGQSGGGTGLMTALFFSIWGGTCGAFMAAGQR